MLLANHMGKELLQKLKETGQLSFVEYKTLLEGAHFFLSQKDEASYNAGLSIICHVANAKPTDKFVKQLLYDCIVASRIFLYGDMLDKFNADYFKDSFSAFENFSKSFYTLDSGTILTKDQKRLFNTFQKTKRLVVSAPTSFGKSRIVPEIIIANSYNNVAIVLPTIALLNETYISFKNNPKFSAYHLINSLSQPLGKSKNILILTPEKMDMFLDENPDFKFDFFVMDEIYKIQDDPERKQIFTHCLYRLSKVTPYYYLIGPYFEGFSKKFLQRTKTEFIKFDTEIVQKEVYRFHELDSGGSLKIGDDVIKKCKGKSVNLRRLVEKISDQTFVYVGNKRTAESLAFHLAEKRNNVVNNELIEYIQENIADDWSLAKSLKKGVSFHHSAIPRYIQREIVDTFNDQHSGLDVIICTPTLIEGINTSAKNVIIYDNNKGGKTQLSSLDVKNIKGRAGRFLIHFVGRVITLEKVDESSVSEIIDFSYFDNDNLSSEENVQVEKSDLEGQNLIKRHKIEADLKRLGIPLSLVKSNKFIPLENQIKLVEFFRENNSFGNEIFFPGNLPDGQKLDAIIDKSHEFLFSKIHAEDKNFNKGNLKRLVKYYVYKNPSLKELIIAQNGKSTDTKVRHAFTLMATYFEFALPKYLVAFEKLFNFSYPAQQINLKYLITKLEFGFDGKHEIALKEAGIPHGMIRKIASLFSDCENLDDIRRKVRNNSGLLHASGLSGFERKMFNKYI